MYYSPNQTMIAHKDKIVFQIQKRVGIAGALVCTALVIVNFYGAISSGAWNLFQIVGNPSIFVLAICAAVAFLTTLRDWRLLRIVQVFVFLTYSYLASVALYPGSLHGALFGVYSAVLGLQYGLLRKHFWPKITLLLVSYVVINAVVAAGEDEFLFHAAPAVALLVGLFIYLFWVAFAEEIRGYTLENDRLKEQRDKNKVFVEFGQNIAGVVHNLKSTLMSIDGCIGVMETATPKERGELLSIQKNSTVKMLAMINNFMNAVRHYQKTEREALRLNRLVESSIEVLRGNRTLKHKLRIEADLTDSDRIYGVPMELMQVIDNVVTNSAEAMAGTDRYTLRIKTERCDEFVRLTVVDQGVGIDLCRECDLRDCLTCNHFDYGRSAKSDGAGVGMMYVRQIVKEMNGRLTLLRNPDTGTTVHIDLPASVSSTETSSNRRGGATRLDSQIK